METNTQPPALSGTPSDFSSDAKRRAPLAMDAAEFARLGHDLVDRIAALLASIPERKVTPGEAPDAVRDLVDAARALPEAGADPGALLGSAADLLAAHSLFNGHPRFFGYITSAPAPIGMLGELLAAAVNANVGAWTLGPLATEIEAQTIRWIADLVGYPRECGGLFVSGGNMANFVGLFAARAAAAGWDVRAEGVAAPGAGRFAVYASAETHTWIQKAADLAGIGTNAIRWVPTTPDLRLDTDALRALMAQDGRDGIRPLMVVGTAGSVSTGAVDPLYDMAAICRESGCWLHVDGAYGAFAAAADGTPRDLGALHLADSVAVDPHKWLYAPIEAGSVLVRDPERLRQAFSYHPPYYHFGQEATNYVDFGPQNSRGFRALKVWLALQHAGREGYVQMIGDDIRLAERLFARVSEHAELEAVTQGLSITTFRFIPADLRARAGDPATEAYLNEVNQSLLDRLQRGGDAFVSNAVIRDRYVLRTCIVNFHTEAADVDALPEIVVRLGRDVDVELRGSGLESDGVRSGK